MINELRNEIQNGNNTNVCYSENDAKMNATTGRALLDLSFKVPQFRGKKSLSRVEDALFLQAFFENPEMFLRYLFYMRDVRGGLGERNTFRMAFMWLCNEYPNLAVRLLDHIAEYGRWDDLVHVALNCSKTEIVNKAIDIIVAQVERDKTTDNVSLLGKWLPSVNAGTVSKKEAKRLIKLINNSGRFINEAEYRKTLAELRKKANVVERDIAAKTYSNINYEAVPSLANTRYSRLFLKYDEKRRNEYLESLQKGNAKINSSVAFPHDIYKMAGRDGVTAEEMWKALPDYIDGKSGVIVVRDGSGSMCCTIPGSNTMALDVASALSIYFAERLVGEFHNKFITFSSRPDLVELPENSTLVQKQRFLRKFNDISNTNIESTFDLLLNTAVNNKLKQEDIPGTILIISDMEFDSAHCQYDSNWRVVNDDDKLFTVIARKWSNAGYEMPKLVFWNVNSRTGAIPVTTNKNGVILVSGYSASICKMVLSDETDPYLALVKVLDTERYNPIVESVHDELLKMSTNH